MKRIVCILLCFSLMFTLCACGNTTNTAEPTAETAPVETISPDILSETVKNIEAELSKTYEKCDVSYEQDGSKITFNVLIVDNDICSHAEELYYQNTGEDEEWQQMKYYLEDYSLKVQSDFQEQYQTVCHCKIRVMNDMSYDQYIASAGADDYSVLYISDGTPMTDVIFDSNYTGSSEPETVTMGMENARERAKSYIRTFHYSRESLIEQLEFEKFTEEEAVYGADHCEADWYEEAVEAAASYLRSMDYSREGLIDQLKFEGFTDDEAEYGVNQVYN